MIESGGELEMNWVWKLYNVALESIVIPGRSDLVVTLCKCKGERIKCKKFRVLFC